VYCLLLPKSLTLIERQLKRFKLDSVRLDGSVPQKKRQQLVHQFQRDPACRAFLTTNAGSTGLNLQAADTVINVDLPWNPAVLEWIFIMAGDNQVIGGVARLDRVRRQRAQSR
jgi:superfamily II DNA/RNA helicase